MNSSEEDKEKRIATAIEMVTQGTAVNAAARAQGIHPATLRHRIKGGRSNAAVHRDAQKLNPAQEKELVELLLNARAAGERPYKSTARHLAQRIVGSSVTIGSSWVEGFLRRHPAVQRMFDSVRLEQLQDQEDKALYGPYHALMGRYPGQYNFARPMSPPTVPEAPYPRSSNPIQHMRPIPPPTVSKTPSYPLCSTPIQEMTYAAGSPPRTPERWNTERDPWKTPENSNQVRDLVDFVYRDRATPDALLDIVIDKICKSMDRRDALFFAVDARFTQLENRLDSMNSGKVYEEIYPKTEL